MVRSLIGRGQVYGSGFKFLREVKSYPTGRSICDKIPRMTTLLLSDPDTGLPSDLITFTDNPYEMDPFFVGPVPVTRAFTVFS